MTIPVTGGAGFIGSNFVLDYSKNITFLADHPGQDRRYAIDARKIKCALGWNPKAIFETGIRKTFLWDLDIVEWVGNVTGDAHRESIDKNYQ